MPEDGHLTESARAGHGRDRWADRRSWPKSECFRRLHLTVEGANRDAAGPYVLRGQVWRC